MLLGRSWSTAPSLAGGVKSSANIVRGISRGAPHSCHRFLSAGTEVGGRKGSGAGSSITMEPKQRSQRRGNSRDEASGKSVPRGRGRGNSSAFRAYQHAKLGQRQPVSVKFSTWGCGPFVSNSYLVCLTLVIRCDMFQEWRSKFFSFYGRG